MNKWVFLFYSFCVFVPSIVYSYNITQQKKKDNDNNISSVITFSKNEEKKNSRLNNDINGIAIKRKGTAKIRKNVNKLYQTLNLDDEDNIDKNKGALNERNTEREREREREKEKEKERVEDEDDIYLKTKSTNYEEKINNKQNEKTINNTLTEINNKISFFSPSSSMEKKTSRKEFINKTNRNILSDESKLEINKGDNVMAISNKKNVMELYAENEKIKSESNTGLFNYFINLFQNTAFMENFKKYVKLFFQKYDQRILESAVYFNFDEVLF